MTKPGSLNQLAIAKPCPASWDTMSGDDKVRHCDLCKLNVYNIAALTTAETLTLIEKIEGRICARLYRRKDGTVLTQDCPVGVRAAWRRIAYVAAGGLAMVLTVSAVVSAKSSNSNEGGTTAFGEARQAAQEFLVKHLPDWMVPESWKPVQFMVMGDIALPPLVAPVKASR